MMAKTFIERNDELISWKSATTLFYISDFVDINYHCLLSYIPISLRLLQLSNLIRTEGLDFRLEQNSASALVE